MLLSSGLCKEFCFSWTTPVCKKGCRFYSHEYVNIRLTMYRHGRGEGYLNRKF